MELLSEMRMRPFIPSQKIEEGVPGAISFLSNPKYTHYIYNTKSSIVLVNKDFVPEKEISATLIQSGQCL